MDESKKELKQKKKEAKAQIKDLKRQQKENRKEISRIKEESGQSHTSAALTVILVLIFLLILLLLIKLNIGGFGSNVLGPIIGDVPYVNKILPESAQVEVSGDAAAKKEAKEDKDKSEKKTTEEATEATTQAVATKTVKTTESQTDSSDKAVDDNGTAASANTVTLDEAMQSYVDTYNSMETESAATILEGMSGDYHLVAEILMNLEPQKRADILAAMSTNNAAKIMKIMERL